MSRDQVLALLGRFGLNSTSFQVLERGFSYWFHDAEACVAYVDTGGAFVAAGAPIAARQRWDEIAQAFMAWAHTQRRRVSFFGTETLFLQTTQMASICIGEQPVWDPHGWEAMVRGHKSLQYQLKRARAAEVVVHAVPCDLLEVPDAPMRKGIDRLVQRWQHSKPMAPMGFLVQLELFSYARERRFFAACVGEAVVGFVAVVPVYARHGWFIEDILRDPHAPNGTVELLVDAVMAWADTMQSHYVTLGLAPLAGKTHGLLRGVGYVGRGFYDFRGLRHFKNKLRPERWDPIYVAYPRHMGPARVVYDTLRAFAPQGLWRFGLQTLLRGPPLAIGLLAAMLVPWTLLLALAVPRSWFPEAWHQTFWVIFDTLLAASLAHLAWRWRPRLGAALAALVTGDACATLAHVITHPLPAGLEGMVIKSIAVLAPALGACVLWGAVRNRRLAYG